MNSDLKLWVEKYCPELNPIQVGMLLRKVGGLAEPELQAKPSLSQVDKSIAGGAP